MSSTTSDLTGAGEGTDIVIIYQLSIRWEDQV